MLIKYYYYTIWNLFIQNLSRLIFLSGEGKMKENFIQNLSVNKHLVIKETVKKIIKDKMPILKNTANDTNTVCLIGHSQFHKWDIKELFGLKVRNCGVNGISMVEYREQILEKNLLKCNSKIYIIFGGTNDIIYDRTPKEILNELEMLVKYIKSQWGGDEQGSNIYFIACFNVNSRYDRDNKTINELNSYLKTNLPQDVNWISGDEMNDKDGNLKAEYTIDGLHLSSLGYEKLKEILEKNICKN